MERFTSIEEYKIINKCYLFKLTNFNNNSNIDIKELKENCLKAIYKSRFGALYYDTKFLKVGTYKISAYGYNSKIILNNKSVTPTKSVFELDFSKTETFKRKSITFKITEDMKELQFLIHFFNSTIQEPVDSCIKNVKIKKLNL